MTSHFLNELLSSIAQRSRQLVSKQARRGGPRRHPGKLADALLSGRGEASGVAIARDLLAAFETLDPAGKTRFFRELIQRFGPNRERLERAIEAYRRTPTDAALAELHDAAEPRRQELIRRLNLAPGGTAGLVSMRTELLSRLSEHPELAALDHDFNHLLSSWFNRGFLTMTRIDWSTPAVILEKIIRYEAVHQIRDWNDLRSRIDPPDRRCYAFFHPALVDEPLIFVEVALTTDTAEAIEPLLTENRVAIEPDEASTAVFYSISNCQKGLRKVSLGNFLIKQVVEDLSRDFPNLKTFVTLSPVPGFRQWIKSEAAKGSTELVGETTRLELKILENPDWPTDHRRAQALKRILLPLAAHYFMRVKTASGKPVDTVARFHLGNGARLERINWLGDRSRHGLEQSAGIMVNYLYRLKDIEHNHEAFVNESTVTASKAVTAMLNTLPKRVEKA